MTNSPSSPLSHPPFRWNGKGSSRKFQDSQDVRRIPMSVKHRNQPIKIDDQFEYWLERKLRKFSANVMKIQYNFKGAKLLTPSALTLVKF